MGHGLLLHSPHLLLLLLLLLCTYGAANAAVRTSVRLAASAVALKRGCHRCQRGRQPVRQQV